MNDQIRTLTLKCPSCGGALDVSPDMERFSCGYCGTEQVVQRRGGTVSLKLVTDAISRVQTGTDRTAAELALVRLQQELAAVDAKLVRPITSLPLRVQKEDHSFTVLFLFISIPAFFAGLWFIAGESYGPLTILIIGWLAFGIPWFIQASRGWQSTRKHFESHVATLKAEREHILNHILANRAVVQRSHEIDRTA